MDELKRNSSDDEERCAQTMALAQVAQQQLAVLEQRADVSIRQTQRDLTCVQDFLRGLAGDTQAVKTTGDDTSMSSSAGTSSCQPPQGPGGSGDNESGVPANSMIPTAPPSQGVLASGTQAVQTTSDDTSMPGIGRYEFVSTTQGPPGGSYDDGPGMAASLMTPEGPPLQEVIMQGKLLPLSHACSVAGAPIVLPTPGTLAAGNSGGGDDDVSAMPPPPARPPSSCTIPSAPSSSSSKEALPPRMANLPPSDAGASPSEEAETAPSVEDTEARVRQKEAND